MASISYYSGDFDEIPDNSKYKGKAYNPDYGDEQVLSDFAKKTLEEIKNRPLNNFSSMDDLRFKIKQSEINSMKPIQDIPEEPEDESILDNIKQIGNTIVDISSATAQGVEFAVDNYNVFKSNDHIKLSDDMLNFQTKFDLISKFDDEKTGFSAMLVSNKADGKLTLVIRGTDDKKDMKDDYNFQTKDHLPNQVLSGINYLESLKKQGFIGENKKIDLVGHSLGGGLAQIIGVMYKGGKEDLVGNVYTFNAPGVAELEPSFDYKKTDELELTELNSLDYVQKRYLNIYKNRIRGYNDKDNVDPEGDFDYIINIGNSGDVVNGLGKKLGKTYQTTQDTHGINTIYVDKIDNLDTINNINTNQTSV